MMIDPINEMKKGWYIKIKRADKALFADNNGMYVTSKLYRPTNITKVEYNVIIEDNVVYTESVSITSLF